VDPRDGVNRPGAWTNLDERSDVTEDICRIPSCTRTVLCRRICAVHYDRLTRGNRRAQRPSLVERIWTQVQRGHVDECWLWYGHASPKGYGKINVDGVPRLVTRVVFQQTYGYLPPVVRHRCDKPPCVNPAHLEPGTLADNNADMAERGRASRGERHIHAVLTAEQVLAIRKAAASGRSQREIASQYGITQQTVSDLHNRRRWRHLT
jgi:hypothetical protein